MKGESGAIKKRGGVDRRNGTRWKGHEEREVRLNTLCLDWQNGGAGTQLSLAVTIDERRIVAGLDATGTCDFGSCLLLGISSPSIAWFKYDKTILRMCREWRSLLQLL